MAIGEALVGESVTMQEDCQEEPQAARGARRVLAVDDDPILLALMGETFLALGYEVSLCESAAEAIVVLDREELELAVIDLHMPQVDGFALLHHIRQHPRWANLPVIVATASNAKESIERAYQLGASSFVTKPINWTQFSHHAQFVMRNGQIERDLRVAQVEAAAAARMKTGLFKVLSHELKTPLTALIGFTDVLAKSLGSKLEGLDAEHLSLVSEAAYRLNQMVGDILLLSRAMVGPARLEKAWHSAHDLLEESLAGFGSRAAALGITLRLAETPAGSGLFCDGSLVRQALRRLIDNALKFSPPGGEIVLWAEADATGEVRLSVSDQGPGMSMTRLRECLQPFVQGDMSYARPVEGMGLGLPIAHTIAAAHGGGLAVTTSPGQGLTASLTLPAAAEASRSLQF